MTTISNIKIEQPDEKKLILHIKPLIFYCFTIFLIGLAIFLFLFSLCIPYSVNLTCDRYQSDITSVINCKLVNHNCWGLRKKEREIHANYYQSIIEEVYLGNSKEPDYEVILLADKEKIKIANYSQTYHDDLWEKQSYQINEFIKNDNSPTITVGENNASVVSSTLDLFIFIIIITVIILGLKIHVNCTLSKEKNTLSIRRYNWLKEKKCEFSLDEIEKVFLETGSGIDYSTSRIIFKIKSGTDIPLTLWLDSYAGKEQAVECIRQFLK